MSPPITQKILKEYKLRTLCQRLARKRGVELHERPVAKMVETLDVERNPSWSDWNELSDFVVNPKRNEIALYGKKNHTTFEYVGFADPAFIRFDCPSEYLLVNDPQRRFFVAWNSVGSVRIWDMKTNCATLKLPKQDLPSDAAAESPRYTFAGTDQNWLKVQRFLDSIIDI